VSVQAVRRPERLVFALPLARAAFGAAVLGAALFINAADALTAPALGLLGASLVVALVYARRRVGTLDRAALLLAGLCLGAMVLLLLLPQWIYGGNVNGIVHRSVISAPLLLVMATATGAHAIRALQGASPSGQDLALYPVFALPIVLALVAYAIILGRVVFSGVGGLSLDLLTTAWRQDQDASGFTYQLGFLNNILGTFLLIAMTLLFAILPGVGAGVFMSEYPGRVARLISFCTTMLRAVAMFIIGATAFGLVRSAGGLDPASFLSQLIRGSYADATGVRPENGSFLTAALFLALLVMPVIAKLTEQGLRSVPREIREGTVALGATEGYGLRRILLPWAAPNILTALLIAGAEAAGSLAIVMFLAGPGQNGVGPLTGVTTLDYAVFATRYGPRTYFDTMKQYQSTAALLLLVLTLGLTVAAMLLQRRFAQRYRGGITGN
jgi:ABC-type phosphate transport system permease subunit